MDPDKYSNNIERFWVKVFKIDSEVLVAICDEDLLGTTLVDLENSITIRVDPNFYGGELLEFDEIIPLLKEATVVNVIGNKIVSRLIEAGFIDDNDKNFITIRGVKHLQIITME
ncbi:MAG: DUF424 family protein [Sulfolobales archaeon]